jgi:WD40 repeat protein
MKRKLHFEKSNAPLKRRKKGLEKLLPSKICYVNLSAVDVLEIFGQHKQIIMQLLPDSNNKVRVSETKNLGVEFNAICATFDQKNFFVSVLNNCENSSKILMYESKSLEIIKEFEVKNEEILHFFTACNDEVLISVGYYIHIWNIKSGEILFRIKLPKKANSSYLDENRGFLFIGFDSFLGIYEFKNLQFITNLEIPDSKKISGIYLTRDEKLIVAADSSLRIYDLETLKCEFVLNGHECDITSFRLANQESLIISLSGDGKICKWNRFGKLLKSYKLSTLGTYTLNVKDNLLIISSLTKLFVLDYEKEILLDETKIHNDCIISVNVFNDKIITSSLDQTIKVCTFL